MGMQCTHMPVGAEVLTCSSLGVDGELKWIDGELKWIACTTHHGPRHMAVEQGSQRIPRLERRKPNLHIEAACVPALLPQ